MVDNSGKALLELSNQILNKKKRRVCFRARGGSMRPFIRSGEIIEIAPINTKKIKSGDIIFYRASPNKLVTHRVIKRITENGEIVFITKGDHSPTFDEYVYSDDVLGKVVAVKKRGRIIRFDKGLMKLLNICYRISYMIIWMREIIFIYLLLLILLNGSFSNLLRIAMM